MNITAQIWAGIPLGVVLGIICTLVLEWIRARPWSKRNQTHAAQGLFAAFALVVVFIPLPMWVSTVLAFALTPFAWSIVTGKGPADSGTPAGWVRLTVAVSVVLLVAFSVSAVVVYSVRIP